MAVARWQPASAPAIVATRAGTTRKSVAKVCKAVEMILASPPNPVDHISTPLALGAIAGSPRTARTSARALLIEWGMASLTESAELIVSELVTNAVQVSAGYAVPPPVQFRMSATGFAVLIEVWDYDPRPPVLRHPADLEEGGRGLVLVATMSRGWKHTWTSSGMRRVSAPPATTQGRSKDVYLSSSRPTNWASKASAPR